MELDEEDGVSLTDRERHDAYEALAETFGDRTDTVIAMMRTDAQEFLTRDEFRVAMARMDSQFAELRVDFKREINDAFAAQTRTLVIGLITAVILIALTNGLAIVTG